MDHSFLLEPAIWKIDGYCIKPNSVPIGIEGSIQVSWKDRNWFKMFMDIKSKEIPEMVISCRYRGNLVREEKQYSYVAQHYLLGNIEGEGKLGFKSIIQHHWSIGNNAIAFSSTFPGNSQLRTTQKRRGFETFYLLNENTYFYTSSILESHNFNNIIEATIYR
ncbi:MAG: hypothetical protein ACFCU5_04260 [Pleurocapsa sp.]